MSQLKSKLESEFWVIWKLIADRQWPNPISEHKFHPTRRWRFDYAWPEHWVAVELQGGIYQRGRHSRPTGQNNDLEKHNEATRCGWTVLYFTGDHLRKRPDWCIELVQEILSNSQQS